MLAYAANRPHPAVRRPSPKTLLLVVGAHAVAVALLITAKPEIGQQITHSPIIVRLIRDPLPPPPNQPTPRATHQQPRQIELPQPPPIPMPQVSLTRPTQQLPEIGNLTGAATQPPQPGSEPQPSVAPPAPTPAWLLTPTSELKPPYPESKLLTGEEATLRLRLSIDEHGRVVAVDPIGPADRTFLDSARRYLMAHWRYSPAIQAGQPVATSLVVTLKFQLDG